jgi:hypothetical protein
MNYENKKICPEDIVRVILPAEMIPDQARVSKVKGEVGYVLRHNLTLYSSAKEPVKIEGYFLIGDRGDINQVEPGKQLCWLVTAEDLVEALKASWYKVLEQ